MLHKLKTLTFLSVPMLLAACGSSDEEYLVDACVKDGTSRSVCECQAKIMRDSLTDKQFAMMADIAKLQTTENLSEQEAQNKLMEKYDMNELVAMGMASIGPAMRAQTECAK